MTISLETALRAAGLTPEENAYERTSEFEEGADINGKREQLGTISVTGAHSGFALNAEFCYTGLWIDAGNKHLLSYIQELQELQKGADDLTARLLHEGLFIQRRLLTSVDAELREAAPGHEYRFATNARCQEELNKFVLVLAVYARETEGE